MAWQKRWVAPHLWLGSYQPLLAFRNCLTFLAIFGVVLDLERVVSFVHSLTRPLMTKRLFNTARNSYCLSLLKPDKLFEKKNFFFFKVALLSAAGQTGSWYSEPHRNFLKAFSPKLKLNCVTRRKEKHSIQSEIAVNLDQWNLLISLLVEDLLSNIKEQTKDNVVWWMG